LTPKNLERFQAMTATPDLARSNEKGLNSAVIEPAQAAPPLPVHVDFAELIHPYFLLYGWILGFPKSVESASIQLGALKIDLLTQARRVSRPDVANHFNLESTNNEHGVYMLIELPDAFAPANELKLSIELPTGAKEESLWPVHVHAEMSDSVVRPYLASLRLLFPNLSPREARRLSRFLTPQVMDQLGLQLPVGIPSPIRFHVDYCGVLDDRYLVVASSVFDPARELNAVEVTVCGLSFDLMAESAIEAGSSFRPNSNLPERDRHQGVFSWFFVKPLDRSRPDEGDAKFTLSLNDDVIELKHLALWDPHESRRDLLSLLDSMEPDATIRAADQILAAISGSVRLASLAQLLRLKQDRAVERLPHSLECSNPRFRIHVDLALPVAERGLYLSGWSYTENPCVPRVLCHCGSDSQPISDRWIRRPRRDVTTFLGSQGIENCDQEVGFSCYIPLQRRDRPVYLSIEVRPGEVKRIRVQIPEHSETALRSVRTLLGSFDSDGCNPREFMESHGGPAVRAIWSARSRPVEKTFLQSIGTPAADPPVSIIIPLYGRFDLARYQLALFADDPEMKQSQLIYVVDDPAIFNEARMACADLYEIYRVPFSLAFAGANLGFAGANNFAAQFARAPHLLLLNSDVMPKRPGWLGELLRTYRSLEPPGLLGCKLLYEDGSLQHAGIEFRRYPRWGGFWINDHPLKGLNPADLKGVREVDAVTAACALLETDLYRKLGGFSEDYVIGDFEDSDLCLRARMEGRRNYVTFDVELYHLERQSQNRVGDAQLRTNLTLYNCWVFNQRWSSEIERGAGAEMLRNGSGR
jgi:O-antigen biosynthesis protein